MLALVRRAEPDREKPTLPVRRHASRMPWAWDGLCFAVPFHEAGTESGIRDIINNVAPATQTNVAWGTDNRGNPSANLGSTSVLLYPDNPRHDRPSTALTAYVRLQRNGAPDAWGGMFGNTNNPSGTPWNTWQIQQLDTTTGSMRGQMTIDGVSVEFEAAANVIPSTAHVSVFLRWREDEQPSLTVLGERGNTLATYTHAASWGGTLTYAADQGIHINSSEIDDENYSALYSQAMVWSRRLSDVELQALVADPFGWYSPRRATVVLGAPFPIVWATTFRVVGYAMFATTGQRDALQAELQAWLDRYTAADVWPSAHVVALEAGTVEHAVPAGFTVGDLMDEEDTPGGPWPGLTWAYEVATKELQGSFGAVPGDGAVWSDYALTGSQFGEVAD